MTLADNEADLVFLLFRHDGEKGRGGGREGVWKQGVRHS